MRENKGLSANRCWYILVVMTVGYIISNFHQVSLSAISVEVGAALRVDAHELALLASAFAYPFAAMQIPAGLLADTLGSRKCVTGALFMVFAGTMIFSCADGMGAAILGRACIGLGCAVILVPLMKLTAVWFPASLFGTLIAVVFMAGAFGQVLATAPTASLSAVIGWRTVYLPAAALTLACAVLVWIVVRDSPDAAQVQGTLDRAWLRRVATVVPGSKGAWMLGGWCFFQNGVYFAFIGLWAGQFLNKGLDISELEAGWILTLPACSLMAAPLFTRAAERCGSPRKMLIGLSLCTLLLSLPLAWGLPRMPAPLLAVYFLCFSVSAVSGAAIPYAMAKSLFPVEYAGTVSGFINIFPFAGSAVVQQSIGFAVYAGLNRGDHPYDAFTRAFIVLTVSAALSCAVSLGIRDQPKSVVFG
jgi:predicted MFS family arabinose efflux permease